MPLISLSEAQSVPAPANVWSWTASIILPNNISSVVNTTGLTLGGLLDRRYVLDVTLPMRQIDVVTRYRGGSNIYFPGASHMSQCAITFYESDSWYVLQTLLNWQNLILSANNTDPANFYPAKAGNYGLPKDYFSKITIEHYNGAGVKQLEADLFGIWPTNVQDVALSYSANHNIPLTCTFAVNDIDLTFGSVTLAGVSPAFSGTTPNTQVTSVDNTDTQ